MNDKQRESAAKYGYDISKVLAAAALAVTVGDAEWLAAGILALAAVVAFRIGWEIERGD